MMMFASRFNFQLIMFKIPELVRLSRFLHVYIAYRIAVAKFTAMICRISHCLHDLIRLKSIVLRSANDKMYDVEVFADRFRYQLTLLKMEIMIGVSRLLCDNIAFEKVI